MDYKNLNISFLELIAQDFNEKQNFIDLHKRINCCECTCQECDMYDKCDLAQAYAITKSNIKVTIDNLVNFIEINIDDIIKKLNCTPEELLTFYDLINKRPFYESDIKEIKLRKL